MDNNEERKRIGKIITEIRKAKGLTQTDLAQKCGLGQGHIARIEAGKYNIQLDTLAVIARGIDCTIELTPKK